MAIVRDERVEDKQNNANCRGTLKECKHTFFAGFFVIAPTAFLVSPFTTSPTVGVLVFLVTAFFLVTPVGLLPLVAGVRFAVVFALVFGLVTFLVVVVFSSTTGKI
jgi:hypothetical protein